MLPSRALLTPTFSRRGRWLPVAVALAFLSAAPAVAAASTGCGTHPGGEHHAEAGVTGPRAAWRAEMPGRRDCPICHHERCVAAPSCAVTLAGARSDPYSAEPTDPLAHDLPHRDGLLPSGLQTQPPTPPPQASA